MTPAINLGRFERVRSRGNTSGSTVIPFIFKVHAFKLQGGNSKLTVPTGKSLKDGWIRDYLLHTIFICVSSLHPFQQQRIFKRFGKPSTAMFNAAKNVIITGGTIIQHVVNNGDRRTDIFQRNIESAVLIDLTFIRWIRWNGAPTESGRYLRIL